MLVTMTAQISGVRDGANWPDIGETVEMDDAIAVDLLAAKLAVAVEVEPVVELAVEPNVSSRKTADS